GRGCPASSVAPLGHGGVAATAVGGLREGVSLVGLGEGVGGVGDATGLAASVPAGVGPGGNTIGGDRAHAALDAGPRSPGAGVGAPGHRLLAVASATAGEDVALVGLGESGRTEGGVAA